MKTMDELFLETFKIERKDIDAIWGEWIIQFAKVWGNALSIDFLTFVSSKYTQIGNQWTNEKGDVVAIEDIFKIYKEQL